MSDTGLVKMIAVLLLVIAGTGCNGLAQEGKAEVHDIEHDLVMDSLGQTKLILRVNASVENTSLDVTIREEGGEELRSSYISEADLDEGVAEAEITINEGTIFNERTYNIIVKKGFSDEVIYSREITINGADPTISDAKFKIRDQPYSDNSTLHNVQITVQNKGNAPVKLDKAIITVNGKETMMFVQDILAPNATKTYSSTTLIELSPGKYMGTIEVEGPEKNLVTVEKTFEV